MPMLISIISPTKKSIHEADKPNNTRVEFNKIIIPTPKITPKMVPEPPLSFVPPITTAAIREVLYLPNIQD